MWPKLTNIDTKIASKIKSYGDSVEASKINSWIRVFSGATTSTNNGLVMQSNTDFKLFRAVGNTTPTIYGDLQSSGVIGIDWQGRSVETGIGRRLRPSPIVTSFSVKEGKDQISRQATLEIKAFSLEQMEKIQTYFLEPGYSLYIEWGWNTPSGIRNITNVTGDLDTLVNTIAQKSLNWNDLTTIRKNSDGEFDCFLGFIVGGNVSGDSENFSVTVELRGAPSLPTYLQSHQGTTKIDVSGSIAESRKATNLFGPSELEAETVDKIALRRFARMFNDLPAFRQITDIYDLNTSAKYQQFINFDDRVKKQVNEALSDRWWQSDTIDFEAGTTTVPITKEKLFSDKRYIRMDLAVEILNKIGSIDRYQIGDKEITFKINIDNTIIGAFPCIFSTKADKLIIPGWVPDFFQYYLQTENIKQLEGGIGGGKLEVNGVAKAPMLYEDHTLRFAPPTALNNFGLKEEAGYWGYLKYLFVNFDMFKSKIEQKNKNIREILLDILNEMSSAVNSFWNFQIVEGEYKKAEPFEGVTTEYNTEKEDGDIILTVIDENFIGQNPNESGMVYFRHVGSGSVFLDANIDISIPADMTNQIVMTRLGGSSNPDAPLVSTRATSFFESKTDLFFKAVGQAATNASSGSGPVEDPVQTAKAELDSLNLVSRIGTITETSTTTNYYQVDANGNETFVGNVTFSLNGATYSDPQGKIAQYEAAQKKYNEAVKLDTERKSQNLTAYLDKLAVVPNLKWNTIGYASKGLNSESELKAVDATGELKLKEFFCIYTYDDTEYFDRLKRDGFAKKLDPNGNLSQPLPIKYTFKILGNSGIRRGDTFNILGIPAKYSQRGLFQVTQIEHSLENNKWFTNITGEYRQIQ